MFGEKCTTLSLMQSSSAVNLVHLPPLRAVGDVLDIEPAAVAEASRNRLHRCRMRCYLIKCSRAPFILVGNESWTTTNPLPREGA